jgi:hypothetical protein
MFWCQFAPLAAEFSVDKSMTGFQAKDNSVLSFGAVGLMMQLLYMYIFTALLKWDRVWWVDGTAVYYALNLDQFTSYFGLLFRQFPLLMRLMTHSTVLLELLGPFSVIMPVYVLRRRIFFPFAFITFHLGLAVFLVLGMFPWTCMAAWLMVLPPEFWEKIPAARLASVTKWFQRLAGWLRAKQWDGQKPRVHFGMFNEAVAAIFLVLVCVWNITQLDVLNLDRTPGFRRVMHVAEIYQRWSMFAPYPRHDDGWYVIESTLFNGEKWNTFLDQPVSFDKPADVAGTYKNSMWRKYLTNIWLKSYNKYRLYFGRYLCRDWNEAQTDPDRRVKTIMVYYMTEMTPPPGEEPTPAVRELTWRHYCFEKPADWKD